MPKFQVYKDAAGKYRFRLRADNNKIIAVGEAYEQYASCINGIRSIQRNFNAPVEDTTVEGQRFSNPKFQVYKETARLLLIAAKDTKQKKLASTVLT
jgi:uncharacterized protein YegP (UPF0339 family)